MKKKFDFKRIISIVLCVLALIACVLVIAKLNTNPEDDNTPQSVIVAGISVNEDEQYDSKDEVAAYLYAFNHLPSNYLTKSEAKKEGWSSGALDQVLPGKAIGGDKFGNNEGLLPKADGRQYYECDIETIGEKERGDKRLVYSNDGLIFYTDDHYESFVQFGKDGWTIINEENPTNPDEQTPSSTSVTIAGITVDENLEYSSKDEVAAYLYAFNHLPSNFMTKTEAKKAGWSGGALDLVVPGKSIGGDKFGNNEGLLPKKSGRQYYECDIDTVGKKERGAKRIIFSNDGLIFYTDDHYETFIEFTENGWKAGK